jgi:hypothetical protein
MTYLEIGIRAVGFLACSIILLFLVYWLASIFLLFVFSGY